MRQENKKLDYVVCNCDDDHDYMMMTIMTMMTMMVTMMTKIMVLTSLWMTNI